MWKILTLFLADRSLAVPENMSICVTFSELLVQLFLSGSKNVPCMELYWGRKVCSKESKKWNWKYRFETEEKMSWNWKKINWRNFQNLLFKFKFFPPQFKIFFLYFFFLRSFKLLILFWHGGGGGRGNMTDPLTTKAGNTVPADAFRHHWNWKCLQHIIDILRVCNWFWKITCFTDITCLCQRTTYVSVEQMWYWQIVKIVVHV